MDMLRIGTKLYGYCNGYFGRDFFSSIKTVEAIGTDWVVARDWGDDEDKVFFYNGDPDVLLEYTKPGSG